MMRKKGLFLFLAVFMFAAISLQGCAAVEYKAIPYYDSTEYTEESDYSIYNEALFRRNDTSVWLPDPAIIRITDTESSEYGYFYLYGTSSGFVTYRSSDMINWEARGITLDSDVMESGLFDSETWAPEVIYDEDDGLYYMFCSATPSNSYGLRCIMFLLYSENPYGPFKLADFEYQNRADSYTLANGEVVTYNDYWADYTYFDSAKYAERVEELEEFAQNENLYEAYNIEGYFSAIDPYPFVDEDGQKYIYYVFRSNGGSRYLAGAKCGESWKDVDYDSLTLLTLAGYMDVQGTEKCDYQGSSIIDEGPVMIKHNGVYNLSYSFGDAASGYWVGQSVSDSPLGMYRKLDVSENAIMLSNDGGALDGISGTGGHALIEVDGELYIVYHRHVSKEAQGYTRCVSIDTVKWVTIEDINGESLDVMYVNGPTINIQPKFDFASEYKNITSRAAITANNMEEGSDLNALSDGLLTMYLYESEGFTDKYIKETYFTDTATITLSFDDYQTVRSVMIYNSKYLSCSYLQIKRIEFDTLNDSGEEIIDYIANLQFDWRGNRHTEDNFSIKSGSAAIAEFDEIKCKEIRITVEIPSSGWIVDETGNITYAEEDYMMFEHEGRVGISEIIVLGK